MSITCTRCDGTGFLNNDAGPANPMTNEGIPKMDCIELQQWAKDNPESDFQICDCCGDGEEWHGVPGEHYNNEDPPGRRGPYAYNGGLCECH